MTNSLGLLPPYGELPPTFWEQHGTAIVIAGIVVVALAAAGFWAWLRPKRVEVLPPEVRARHALEGLLPKVEDGAVLSEASDILRHYFTAAFGLPPGELTTSEFGLALSRRGEIGPELAATVTDFLREADERKFSPATAPAPLGAAARALRLVELGEARREQLRQMARTGEPPTSSPAAESSS